jgi:hypothetical protein
VGNPVHRYHLTATQPCGHVRNTAVLLTVSMKNKAYCNNLEQKGIKLKSKKLDWGM